MSIDTAPTLTLVPTTAPGGLPHGTTRYDLPANDGVRFAVLVHGDGERELFLLTETDDEPAAVFQLTAEQAVRLGDALCDRPPSGRHG